MELGWTDGVENQYVLHRVEEERNLLHKKKGRLTRLVTSSETHIEGKIEG
jgi:hypothetical protein